MFVIKNKPNGNKPITLKNLIYFSLLYILIWVLILNLDIYLFIKLNWNIPPNHYF